MAQAAPSYIVKPFKNKQSVQCQLQFIGIHYIEYNFYPSLNTKRKISDCGLEHCSYYKRTSEKSHYGKKSKTNLYQKSGSYQLRQLPHYSIYSSNKILLYSDHFLTNNLLTKFKLIEKDSSNSYIVICQCK